MELVVRYGIGFARHTIGIIFRPYETYREIADRGEVGELAYLALLLAAYFALASLVKTAAFAPYLLTKHFLALASAVGVGYALSVSILWFAGHLFDGRGTLPRFALLWAYTLVPTMVWFLMTSLLYVVLPPPRTTRLAGVSFSVLYLVVSATLFWWKVTLGYLTLRFGLRLTLPQILGVVGVWLPIVGVWSYLMYAWGVFKVPFL